MSKIKFPKEYASEYIRSLSKSDFEEVKKNAKLKYGLVPADFGGPWGSDEFIDSKTWDQIKKHIKSKKIKCGADKRPMVPYDNNGKPDYYDISHNSWNILMIEVWTGLDNFKYSIDAFYFDERVQGRKPSEIGKRINPIKK